MTENEMEDLLWEYSERFLSEKLTQFERQHVTTIGRPDLIFTDRIGRYLVVEVKHGKLKRGAIEQLHDYYGMMKRRFPNMAVELMVVANQIPPERLLACEKLDIEALEISEKKFRDVASEVNYVFKSELREHEPPDISVKGPVSQSEGEGSVPISLIPYQTIIRLRVSPQEAWRLLKQVLHENFLNTLKRAWKVDKEGNVKAQSVCWLFCWAKTGNNSIDAAEACRSVFDKIFDKTRYNITYTWFDSKVDHEWARKARYKNGNIEFALNRLLER